MESQCQRRVDGSQKMNVRFLARKSHLNYLFSETMAAKNTKIKAAAFPMWVRLSLVSFVRDMVRWSGVGEIFGIHDVIYFWNCKHNKKY